jgi:outer membrane receptor protein involved in Fe transport
MRVSTKEAMRHLLLAAALLLGATPAWAQTGKITGVVTAAQTGEPIAGVQIYIEELQRGALTRENGRYFLINLPVGTYTVVAEIIGYATVRKENVVINVDVTRQVNFELLSRAVEIEEVVVEVQATPLIDVEATGARDVVTAAEIEALPVTDLKEVLALQHGFIDLPDNTDVIAFTDARRGLEPVHIRGGRLGETTTLIDGIPVNNFVFGGPSFFVNRSAVQQLDYIRGGFDAQYGNALSGVINIATKEGGTELRGAAEYQGSGVSGALGSDYDDLRNYHQAEAWARSPALTIASASWWRDASSPRPAASSSSTTTFGIRFNVCTTFAATSPGCMTCCPAGAVWASTTPATCSGS